MMTVRSGLAFNVTVTVTKLPSATVYVPCSKLTRMAGTSSSVIVTTASLVVPADTPAGRVLPKVSFTLSPSSLSWSWVALKLMSTSVSPALKVTLAGTPE